MVGAILTNKSPVDLGMTTPIARLTGEYEVIVVPAASELKTIADLIAKLKADAGSVSMGGGSAGGTDHILAGLIAKAAGADMTKLNYVALLGRRRSAGRHPRRPCDGRHQRLQRMGRADRSRANCGRSRFRLPSDRPGIDIPTLKEQGVDVELANWRGDRRAVRASMTARSRRSMRRRRGGEERRLEEGLVRQEMDGSLSARR